MKKRKYNKMRTYLVKVTNHDNGNEYNIQVCAYNRIHAFSVAFYRENSPTRFNKQIEVVKWLKDFDML